MKPFRWDITRREQLGQLAEVPSPAVYAGFEEDLRAVSARVIDAAGDADLAFIGRSPESIFDYLSGTLLETSWSERLLLANLSLRYSTPKDVKRDHPGAMQALRDHLLELRISPAQLVTRPRPLALIDLVSSGSTFKHVTELLLDLTIESSIDPAAVRRKLRYVGITWRTKNSPNTYRWHQHADWLREFPKSPVKNVSIPGEMWAYLGNCQPKVTESNPPWRWAYPNLKSPPRDETNLTALRRALDVFDLASNAEERRSFSNALCDVHAIRQRWCRSLVAELRGRSST
ncbi:MAG: hypothetical protein ACR2QU_05625 [Gammaproteobacteria bacterium]